MNKVNVKCNILASNQAPENTFIFFDPAEEHSVNVLNPRATILAHKKYGWVEDFNLH
jgi:hypothetical protein